MRKSHATLPMIAVSCLLVLAAGATVPAETIHEIQFVDLNADPTGSSPYDGQYVHCDGGIVTHIWTGNQPRLVLQDPNASDGWGGIQIKGWSGANTFSGIQVGDWVSVDDVYVEEFRGTTFLQFGGDSGPAPNATFTVQSTGNPLPGPIVVTTDQIAAPIEGPASEWRVTDHSAEPLESMYLRVENVLVHALGMGKNSDNYNLHNSLGDVWASDYMNEDRDYFDLYHPDIQLGSAFQSVSGILEQYTKESSGWDYYQLLTTHSGDLVAIPEPATGMLLLTCLFLMVLQYGRRRYPE